MPRTVFCPGCGKELLSHLNICPICATPLPPAEPQPEQPPRAEDYQSPYGWMSANETPKPVTRTPATPDYVPPTVAAQSLFPCPSCGKTITRANAFCPQCGRPLQALEQQSPNYQTPLQPVYYPVVPPPAGRTKGEYALIIIIALLAAMIILAKFC
jgi:predicted amidophosphoribosyltransferase